MSMAVAACSCVMFSRLTRRRPSNSSSEMVTVASALAGMPAGLNRTASGENLMVRWRQGRGITAGPCACIGVVVFEVLSRQRTFRVVFLFLGLRPLVRFRRSLAWCLLLVSCADAVMRILLLVHRCRAGTL